MGAPRRLRDRPGGDAGLVAGPRAGPERPALSDGRRSRTKLGLPRPASVDRSVGESLGQPALVRRRSASGGRTGRPWSVRLTGRQSELSGQDLAAGPKALKGFEPGPERGA